MTFLDGELAILLILLVDYNFYAVAGHQVGTSIFIEDKTAVRDQSY